jgi:putative tricarboxylic transport membrane protein
MTGDTGPTVERRRADRAALLIAAAMFVLAAVVYWDSTRLGGVATYARIGPQLAPQVIALCLAGLGVWTLLAAFRGDFPPREPQELRPVLWILAGLAGQLVLLRYAGFSIATGVLFGFVAYGLGRKPLWLAIPIGVILALGMWLIFARGLALNLPAGPLEAIGTAALDPLIDMVRNAWSAAASVSGGSR